MIPKLKRLSLAVEKNPTYLGYLELCNELDSEDSIKQGTPFRIAVLRNFTIEPLLPVLKGEIFLSGFHPDFYLGDFDTIMGDVKNPDSVLYAHKPQMIFIAQWFELLSPKIASSFIKLSLEERESEMSRVLKGMTNILHSIRTNSKSPIIINNFQLPHYTTLGILDLHSVHSQKKWFQQLNDLLLKLCSDVDNVFCIDLASVLSEVGYSIGYNQRQWEIAKAPLGQKLLIPLAQEYSKFVRAFTGKTKKCLILDCDGTLWGGVLGEDGPTGIKLGITYPGSGYLSFQTEVVNLYSRGVILALCSKNNEEDIMEILDSHENMALKKHHIACWQINWEDKASNILKIAKELNIGLDSIVFVDDNEFECDWIRNQLPEIKVLHLKGDPALFQNVLTQAGYFDSFSFSEEDSRKTEMYINEKKRSELLISTSSYQDYLVDLNIQAKIQKAQPQDFNRISQLTQKTNQFNLTTFRYTEADIKQLVGADDSDIYTLKVSDKISDLGLIAIAIIKYQKDTAFIDSFLMSCRALGRGLEDALLAYIIKEVIALRITIITGRYVPTKKNIQAKDFYMKNNFTLADENVDFTEWTQDFSKNSNILFPEWVTINN